MIGSLGGGDITREQASARSRGGGGWRAVAVLGMLTVPLAAAGVKAVPAAAATTYTVTATIGVASGPSGVGVDPATHTVYVASPGLCEPCNGAVSVINEATNTVTATIDVGSGAPQEVGVDPATDTVYVTNDLGNTVSVIDGATNTVTATIDVASGPQGVAVDPATDTVYVTNVFSNTVSVIDGATNTVTAIISVGNDPTAVGVDPATHAVYVTNQASGTVSVIDGATNTVTATTVVGNQPDAVGVDPGTDTIYVANELSGTVSVIDGAANTVTATIDVSNDELAGVGVDPATHTVYVSNQANGGAVSVIDGATNTVTATIDVGNPHGVGVDPATHAVYVADYGSSTVSVITPVSDDDLAISQPSNITTDATGPSGATVSYALPQVSDPDDTSVPAASCTPAPGSVFAIGATTVRCSASDPDDSNSPVTVSFTVTVNGAAAQLVDLHQAVQHVGIGKSLAYTVAAAQKLAARHPRMACLTLTTFIIEVKLQTPRFIPATTSAQLITDAKRIQAVLAC